jgi:hypothetical protein
MPRLKSLHERLADMGDKRIRNNPKDELEQLQADQRAKEELDNWIRRWEEEPEFQKRLLKAFAAKLSGQEEELIDYKTRYLQLLTEKEHAESVQFKPKQMSLFE